MLAAFMSALHLLSLGVGLGAVFSRGLAVRSLAAGDARAVSRVLFADSFWGIAAVLWRATGLTRLFGTLDKALDFYLYNGFFWIKMGLVGLVLVLEIVPMLTFINWRKELRKGSLLDTRSAPRLVRFNDAETLLVLLIPFAASAMARGLWVLEV